MGRGQCSDIQLMDQRNAHNDFVTQMRNVE